MALFTMEIQAIKAKSIQQEHPFVLQKSKTPEQTTNSSAKLWSGSMGVMIHNGTCSSWVFWSWWRWWEGSSLQKVLLCVICPTQHEQTWKHLMPTTAAAYLTEGENQFSEPSTHLSEGLHCKFQNSVSCMSQFTCIHASGKSKSGSISTNLAIEQKFQSFGSSYWHESSKWLHISFFPLHK